MLTWIVAHSDSLCNFLTPLLIGFSPAQLRHALNCVEALLVCASKHKTLSALTRLLRLPHADEFALADFFRASPWDSSPIQKALTLFLLQIVCQIHQCTGWRLLFVDRRWTLSQRCGHQRPRSRYLTLRSLSAPPPKRKIHQQFALCHARTATRSRAIRVGMAALSPAQTRQATQSHPHERNETYLSQTHHPGRTDVG
jgi:hypothetical protein